MKTALAPYDVFLSYSARAGATAEGIKRACLDAGLTVFTPTDADPSEPLVDQLREGLADARAIFLVVGGTADVSSTSLVELGMALAWHKPVYVLLDGVAESALPEFLRAFQILPVSRLAHAIRSVQRDEPFSDEEREILIELYGELGVVVDRLATQPAALNRLTRRFEHQTHSHRTADRLLRELLTLRKRGALRTTAT
jgi:nucleoside 2-deoxyribosyltransferase